MSDECNGPHYHLQGWAAVPFSVGAGLSAIVVPLITFSFLTLLCVGSGPVIAIIEAVKK